MAVGFHRIQEEEEGEFVAHPSWVNASNLMGEAHAVAYASSQSDGEDVGPYLPSLSCLQTRGLILTTLGK